MPFLSGVVSGLGANTAATPPTPVDPASKEQLSPKAMRKLSHNAVEVRKLSDNAMDVGCLASPLHTFPD